VKLEVASREEGHSLIRDTCPSVWSAENVLIRHADGQVAPFSVRGCEYLSDPADDLSRRVIGKKGAQVYFTTAALARSLWTLKALRRDVLYVLPTTADVTAFIAGRFDFTRRRSPSLASLFTQVDNVTHKVTLDGANFYARGSNSPSGLKSIPVALLVLDEFDEMEAEAVALARERLSAQTEMWALEMSTPTLPGFGIDREWQDSDQRSWHVPCPRCEAGASLRWPDSIAGDLAGDPTAATWRCRTCGERWTEEEKRRAVSGGAWIAHDPEKSIRGYHVPQLLAPARTAADYVARWQRALVEVQEYANFYRSVLAETYVPEGTKLDEAMIVDALASGPSQSAESPPQGIPVTIGIDAGVARHYLELAAWPAGGRKEVLLARVIPSFDDAFALALRFDVRAVVVDANPNTEAARAFQGRCAEKGIPVWLAFYSTSMRESVRWNADNGTVSAQRTEILDRVVSRFATRRISLPRDIVGDYLNHHRALVRVVTRNESKGNEEARYESSGPDHFAHAAAYDELAGMLCPEPSAGEKYVPPEELRGRVMLDNTGWPVEIDR
jgi:hypothetical protein